MTAPPEMPTFERLRALMTDLLDREPNVTGNRINFDHSGVNVTIGTFPGADGLEHAFVQARLAEGIRCSEDVMFALLYVQEHGLRVSRISVDPAGSAWVSAEIYGPALEREALLDTINEIQGAIHHSREEIMDLSAKAKRKTPVGVPAPPEPRGPVQPAAQAPPPPPPPPPPAA